MLPQGDGDGEAATPWSVAFAPDGRSVAVGGGPGRTLVWDLTTGRSTCTLVSQGTHWTWEYGRTDTQVQTVATPSPGTVLTPDLRTRLWSTRTGTVVTTIRPDDEPEALSPDGTLVVLSGPDATTVVEVATGRIRLRLPPSRGIGFAQAAFSPDDRSLAVILDHAVGVWPVP